MANTFNPNIQEVETRDSDVLGHHWLHSQSEATRDCFEVLLCLHSGINWLLLKGI